MTNNSNHVIIPASLKHAHKVWELLLAAAKTEIIEKPLSDDKFECLVFRGRIGDIFTEAGVSKTYYSAVRKILVDCGAMTMIYRGTIHAPSVLVLNPDTPPPDDPSLIVKSDDDPLTTAERFGILEKRVEILERSHGGINILEAFKNMERRLGDIEAGESNTQV